ncbi:MAG: twin-arginine translocase TatA/TatE family subunit [Armatimonadota bacterium]
MLPVFAYWANWEMWAVIGVVAVLLFGGTKIPQLAKGLGEGIREFKKSVMDEDKPEAKSDTEAK